MYLIDSYPFLKQIIEEMGNDQGFKNCFFERFEAALMGKGPSGAIYDVDRLEKLAEKACAAMVFDVVTSEEAWAALAYGEPDDNNQPLWIQMAAGAGELNDVIRQKDDWEYLFAFLDDVFDAEVDTVPPTMH